jgi:WhiB family redox-sensing transcriptional regulator
MSEVIKQRRPLLQNYEWQRAAACRGMDTNIFFESDNSRFNKRGPDVRRAKEICKPCPVRDECLEAAKVNNEQFGIFGGTTPGERRSMRRGSQERG